MVMSEILFHIPAKTRQLFENTFTLRFFMTGVSGHSRFAEFAKSIATEKTMRKIPSKAVGAIVGAVATLFSFAGFALASPWNMPTPYPAGSFHTQNIVEFADDIRAATDGVIDISVHPAGSLVKHPEIKNAVRSGQVEIGEFLLSRLSNENPVFEVDAIPFLAASYDASRRLWHVQRPDVEELLARQNMTVLYAVPWPPQGIYTKEPLRTIADLSGMRFRTYNAATERFAQLAGAAPTQVEVPDIAQAFATGRVEGMITSSTTGVNSKAWDYLGYYTDTRAFLPKNIVVVNTDTFNALTEAQKRAVRAAAARAEERGWQLSLEETSRQTQALAENGINVTTPSAELASALAEIGSSMAGEWVSRAQNRGAALLERFRAAQSATASSSTN